MKLTKHLDKIYQLVLDRADPAEVRGQIEFIRDQVDAAGKVEAKLRKQIARDKKSHAKEIARLKDSHATEISKLKEAHQQDMAQPVERRSSRREQLERAGF